MGILGHHGRRISLRVLFHAPAGPGLGIGTRRRLSAIAFPVIGIRLFRPASTPRPLSGLPAVRAGVRGVSSSRLLEGHARPGPRREAQLKVENERLQAYSGFASSNSSGAETETSAATAPAASDAPPPTHRHDSRVASNAVGPVRNAAIIPTSLPLSKTRSCRPTSATARGVVSRSPIPRHRGFHNPGDRCPGPSPSHSPSPLSTDLLVWCSSRHRHRPATGPADSQEHAGDLDLGDGALGQVSVLPADLSALGGLAAAAAWTCRWAP